MTKYQPGDYVWVIDPETDRKRAGVVQKTAFGVYDVAVAYEGCIRVICTLAEWLERREPEREKDRRV